MKGKCITNIYRKLREERGLPAASSDEIFDLQRSDWDGWEHGFKKPEPELLDEMAEHFGISVKELKASEE